MFPVFKQVGWTWDIYSAPWGSQDKLPSLDPDLCFQNKHPQMFRMFQIMCILCGGRTFFKPDFTFAARAASGTVKVQLHSSSAGFWLWTSKSASRWTVSVIWAFRLAVDTVRDRSVREQTNRAVRSTCRSKTCTKAIPFPKRVAASAGKWEARRDIIPQTPGLHAKEPPQYPTSNQLRFITLEEIPETDTRGMCNWENTRFRSRKLSQTLSDKSWRTGSKVPSHFLELSSYSKEREIAISSIYRRKGASCTSENQLRIDPAPVNIHEAIS